MWVASITSLPFEPKQRKAWHEQLAEKDKYKDKLRQLGMRQKSRDDLFNDQLTSYEGRKASQAEARTRIKARNTRRIAEQQLVHLTRTRAKPTCNGSTPQRTSSTPHRTAR